MMQWLRDVLGINRYHICWRYETLYGIVEGDTREMYRYIGGPLTKRSAERTCRPFNDVYGEGTHWIEQA